MTGEFLVTGEAEARPLVTPAERARFQQAQAYEDAVAYRRARLVLPCTNCGLVRCDDHAADADLISRYLLAAAPGPPRAAGGHGQSG